MNPGGGSRSPGLFVVAGEASADAHGARILDRLANRFDNLDCYGLGGDRLAEAGLERLGDAGDLNVVGLSEVLSALPRVLGLRDRLLAEVDRRKPAAALLIDLPGFNLHLAARLKRRKIPVVYYIAPQAWAWREGRVKKIRRRVDKLCVIFPFEEAFFAQRGVEVEFVGHPLLEEAGPTREPERRRVAIVPGSRPREIERLLPSLAGAARILADSDLQLEFVLPLAPGVAATRVRSILSAAGVEARLVQGGARAALDGARLGLVTSGTATLEGALAGVPMVVVYRVSRMTYAMVRPLFRLDHFCIVNILAGASVLPELVQGAVRPDRIAAAALPFLADGPERERVVTGLAEVVDGLRGPVPSERVAAILGVYLKGEAA